MSQLCVNYVIIIEHHIEYLINGILYMLLKRYSLPNVGSGADRGVQAVL